MSIKSNGFRMYLRNVLIFEKQIQPSVINDNILDLWQLFFNQLGIQDGLYITMCGIFMKSIENAPKICSWSLLNLVKKIMFNGI